MILLDTNIISEVIRPAPNRRVAAWMRRQPRQDLLTSAIVRAEILYGFAIMPDGGRRRRLLALADAVFAELGPLLPFTARLRFTTQRSLLNASGSVGRSVASMH